MGPDGSAFHAGDGEIGLSDDPVAICEWRGVEPLDAVEGAGVAEADPVGLFCKGEHVVDEGGFLF